MLIEFLQPLPSPWKSFPLRVTLLDPVFGNDGAFALDFSKFGRVGKGGNQMSALRIPFRLVLGPHGQQFVTQLGPQWILEAAQDSHNALEQLVERLGQSYLLSRSLGLVLYRAKRR